MVRISEILDFIKTSIYTGDKNLVINEVRSFSEINGRDNVLTWCNDENLERLDELETSAVIVVGENTPNSIRESKSCIIVSNPRRTFQEILIKFFQKKEFHKFLQAQLLIRILQLERMLSLGKTW